MRHHKGTVLGISCVLLLMLLFLVTACGGGDTTTTAAPGGTETTAAPGGTETTAAPGGTETTASSGEQKVLKVGALLSLDTVQGVEMKKWLEVFAQLYNDDGGWEIGGEKYKVQPMIYDVGVYDATKTRLAAEKAVLQDKVQYMVCNWGDIPIETVSVTEANKVLWMGMDFTDDTVSPNLNYAIRAQGLFFAQGLMYYVIEDYMKQGAKTGLIVNPDNQQGHAGTQLVTATGKALGLEWKDPIYFAMDTTDFSPIATKIVNANPDMVYLAYMAGDNLLNSIAALKDAGYKGLIAPGDFDYQTMQNAVKRVGEEYLEGMLSGMYDPVGIETDPKILRYVDAYKAKYGEWYYAGCFWVGPWFLFEDAVNATQSTDVDTLVEYLHNSKHGVRTLTGYSQLFARPELGNLRTVDSAPGHYLGEIKDGKFVYSSTISAKDQYLSSVLISGLQDVYTKYWEEHGVPEFPDQPSRLDISDIK